MPQTRECDFCGDDIEPGTGTMFVRTDGTTTHFCSSKCEKNADLGREPRDVEWTSEGREAARRAQQSREDREAAESESESRRAADAEAEAADPEPDESELEAEPADSDEESDEAEAEDADEEDDEE